MPKRKAASGAARTSKKAKNVQKTAPRKTVKETVSDEKQAENVAPEADTAGKSTATPAATSTDWNLRIGSWNINGIKAWTKKNAHSYLVKKDFDMICLQETKCSESDIPKEIKLNGYEYYFSSAEKKGYSGTGLLSKIKPMNIEYGIGVDEHDHEGRVITAEYDKFYLVGAYIPNSGRKLVRLDYRQQWDVDFRKYLQDLDKKKPVILCGDLNVAHLDIDLANPKTNTKTAGFTKEERDGFGVLLNSGFVDTFRYFYPDKVGAYTFWSSMSDARSRNIGWRLDYFVVSDRFISNVADNVICSKAMGSDHCPIVLNLKI